MYRNSRKRMTAWGLVLALVIVFLLPTLVKAEGTASYAIVKGEFIPASTRSAANDLEFTNSLELASNFHIFSQKAYLQAHTNGNIATALIDGPANFGTAIKQDSRASIEYDIHYIQAIQHIASSSFVTSTAKRGLKVYFGTDVQLSLVDNGNKLAANGFKLDHLKFTEAYQDAPNQPYIDFDQAFDELATISDAFYAASTTPGVIINDADMNNRYIDIQQVDLDSVRQRSEITVVVKDDAEQPLPNASYDLYRTSGDEQVVVASNITSDEQGLMQLDLPAGTHFLTEIAAPEGYENQLEPLHFTVESQNYDYIYVDVKASFLSRSHNPTPIKIKGLSENGPSIILNVIMDLQDQSTLTINSHIQPEIDGTYRNNRETEYFSDAKILWNFPNSLERITIHSPFSGSILATGAKVSNSANLDGNIIAKEVHIQGGESHRWDFQTRISNPSTELNIRYKKNDVQEFPNPTEPEASEPEAIPSPTPVPTTVSTTESTTTSTTESTTTSSEETTPIPIPTTVQTTENTTVSTAPSSTTATTTTTTTTPPSTTVGTSASTSTTLRPTETTTTSTEEALPSTTSTTVPSTEETTTTTTPIPSPTTVPSTESTSTTIRPTQPTATTTEEALPSSTPTTVPSIEGTTPTSTEETTAIPSPTPLPTTESTTIKESSQDVSTTSASDHVVESSFPSDNTSQEESETTKDSQESTAITEETETSQDVTTITLTEMSQDSSSASEESNESSNDVSTSTDGISNTNENTSEGDISPTGTGIFMVGGASTYVGSSNSNDTDSDADLITNPPLTGDLISDWVIALLISVAATFVIGGIGAWFFEKKLYKD